MFVKSSGRHGLVLAGVVFACVVCASGAGVWTGAGENARWSNPANWQAGEVPCTNAFDAVDLGALPAGGSIEVDVPVMIHGTLALSGAAGDVWTLAAATGGSLRFNTVTLDVAGGRLDIAARFRSNNDGEITKDGDGEVRFLYTSDYGASSRPVRVRGGRLTCAAPGGIENFRIIDFGGEVSLECDTVLAGLSTDYSDDALLKAPVLLNGHNLTLKNCDRTRSFGAEIVGTNSWLTVTRGADVRLDVSPDGLAGAKLANADLTLGAPKAVCLDFEDATTPSRDVRGHDLGLVAVGSPRVVVDPERGNVLELDGNSYLKGPDTNNWFSPMPSGRQPFTVALWLKLASNVSQKAAVFSWGNATLDQFVGLRVHNAKDVCYAWYGDNYYFNKTLNDSAWHHVAVSYNGESNLRIYYDGTWVANLTNRLENIQAKNFIIGNGAWSNTIGGAPTTGGFKGWIDDFTVIRHGTEFSSTIGALREKGAAAMDVRLPSDSAVEISAGGTLTLEGAPRVATIAGEGLLGGIDLRDGSELTVAGPGAATSTVYSAQIRGNASLVKDGADYELVLGGANAYTGATTVAAGTLTVKTPIAQDGLVAYWDFEDASDFGLDRSASGFNLKTVKGGGITAVADGVVGAAVHFDGAQSACLIQDAIPPVGFPTGNDPFTASVWVRPAAAACSGNCPVFEWGQAGPQNGCAMLRFDGASTLCFIKMGSENDLRGIPFTGGRFDDGAWHHIAVTSDGTTQACWVDGVKAKSAQLGTPLVIAGTNGTMRIASKKAGGDGYYSGDIDELRIYNRTLSEAEILDEYALRRPAGFDPIETLPQPIAHWSFDDPENLGKDSGPYGYDLVTNGICATYSDDLTYGRALDLRSSVMYLSQPQGVPFPAHFPTGNAPFTVSCRLRPAPSCRMNGGAFFWGDSNLGQTHYFILAPDQNLSVRKYKCDFGGATVLHTESWGTEAPNRVRWMHLVAVYSPYDTGKVSRRCHLYVNGRLVESATRGGNLAIPAVNLFIGRKLGSKETFQGLLDDVQVFDKALSYGQVLTLSRAFAGTPSPVPAGSPVSVAAGARLKVASAVAKCGALSGTGEVLLERESRLAVTADSTFAGMVAGDGTLCADACTVSLQGSLTGFNGTFESRDGGRISGASGAASLVKGSQVEIVDPTAQLPLLDVTGAGRVGTGVELVWNAPSAGTFVLMRAAGGFTRADVETALATWTCTAAGSLRVVPRLDATGTVLTVNVLKKGTLVVFR